MPSSDDEEAEDVAAEAFTPVKIAVGDLILDLRSRQTRQAQRLVNIDLRPVRICW
jgi:hypothetical protein